MSKDDVQAFAEAGGFRHEGRCVAMLNGNQCGKDWWGRDGLPSEHGLPDFLHDLSACFDVLEWVCEKNRWTYDLSVVPAEYGECKINERHFNLMLAQADVEACATTKQEAIIKAVLSAKESSK